MYFLWSRFLLSARRWPKRRRHKLTSLICLRQFDVCTIIWKIVDFRINKSWRSSRERMQQLCLSHWVWFRMRKIGWWEDNKTHWIIIYVKIQNCSLWNILGVGKVDKWWRIIKWKLISGPSIIGGGRPNPRCKCGKKIQQKMGRQVVIIPTRELTTSSDAPKKICRWKWIKRTDLFNYLLTIGY